jgi:hypothetical protein
MGPEDRRVAIERAYLAHAGDLYRVASAGTASPNEASVTVVDTATGEVRLIAGQLGSDTLTLNRVLEP